MAVKRIQLQIRLDNVRISFPTLWEPEAMKPGDRPAYSAQFLIEKDSENATKIRQAIKKIAIAKWKGKAKAILLQLKKADRLCLKDGDTKLDSEDNPMEGYEGHYFISTRSYVRPTVVDKNPKKPLTENDGKLYSGCHVNAYLALWVQTGQYGKRINAQLQGVQFAGEGESFGGGKAADPNVFDSIADEFDDDDSEVDADDLIGDEGGDFDDDIPF